MNRLTELAQQLQALDDSLAGLASAFSLAADDADIPSWTGPGVDGSSSASSGETRPLRGFGISGLAARGLAMVGLIGLSVAVAAASHTAIAWTGAASKSFIATSGVWNPSPAFCTTNGLSFTPANTMTGTSGIDFLFVSGTSGKLVLALGGMDVVVGGHGRDCIDGGHSNDLLKGFGDDDVIIGGKGNDTIFGGDGNDAIDGGPGYDVCIGGAGTDAFVNCELVYQGDEPPGGDHCGDSHDLEAAEAGGARGGNDRECDCEATKSRSSGECDRQGAASSATTTSGTGDPAADPADSSPDETPTPVSPTATLSPSTTATPTQTPTSPPTPTPTPTRTPTRTPTPAHRAPHAEVTGIAIFPR